MGLITLVLIIVLLFVLQRGVDRWLFADRPLTRIERAAITWTKQHLGPDSLIAVQDDFHDELREPGFGGPAFLHVYNTEGIASDADVRDAILQGDWRRIDYVLVSTEQRDTLAAEDTLTATALENANLVRRWEPDPADPDNGRAEPVELWKVAHASDTERRYLLDSDTYIRSRFEQDGAYFNADGTVTSENQAYAMLRAVWLNDRTSFDAAWAWATQHLMRDIGLLAWLWQDGAIVDPHTASDADVDAALALLLGSRLWDDAQLHDEGVAMVQAIWEHQITDVNGSPYLAVGEWATDGRIVGLNPSYFSPYAFRIFQEADPEHEWLAVVDSSYEVLFAMSEVTLGVEQSSGLPPDWVGLDRDNGEFVPYEINSRVTTRYGYDAARTYWRIALDERWADDGRPGAYLMQAGFLRDEVARKGFVSAVYEHDGTIVEERPSAVALASAVAALLTLDPTMAHDLFAREFIGNADRRQDGISWRDPDDLYTQEWGWFTVALYAGATPDLWHDPDDGFVR